MPPATKPRPEAQDVGPAGSAPPRDIAGTLHEVSNALTVVLGWLEHAQRSLPEGHAARRGVDVAMARARHGRDLARGALGVQIAPADDVAELGALAREAATGVEPEAERRDVRVVVACADGASAPVEGASTVLQILTNLLLNALAMAPAGTTVRIDVRAAGEMAEASVSDEGPGVPPDLRDGLFRAGVSSRPGGAGVGLRHSHALASGLGGSLALVPSERGARFVLSWPVGPGPASGPQRASRPPGLGGVRVLVLEDDEAVLSLLGTALALRGAEVVCARSAEEATRAGEAPFHAALLDLSPTGGDAAGVVARLRASSPELHVVVISGSASGAEAALPEGSVVWVRKPFEVDEVLRALAAP